MGEIGEAVGNDELQIGQQRCVVRQCVADRPVAAFVVAEPVRLQQVFVIGIELGELLVLAAVAARADRAGERGRIDAVPLQLVEMFDEQVDERRAAGGLGEKRKFIALDRRVDDPPHQLALDQRRHGPGRLGRRRRQDTVGEGVEREHPRIEAGDQPAVDEPLPDSRGTPRGGGQPECATHAAAGMQNFAVLADESVRFSAPGWADEDGDVGGALSVNSGRKWRCVNRLGESDTVNCKVQDKGVRSMFSVDVGTVKS